MCYCAVGNFHLWHYSLNHITHKSQAQYQIRSPTRTCLPACVNDEALHSKGNVKKPVLGGWGWDCTSYKTSLTWSEQLPHLLSVSCPDLFPHEQIQQNEMREGWNLWSVFHRPSKTCLFSILVTFTNKRQRIECVNSPRGQPEEANPVLTF